MDLESIHKARQLAYFLHRNKAVALRITVAALAKIELAVAKQERRSFYQPKRQRSKVAMNRSQLLQGLVYLESEPWEREQERDAGGGCRITDRDLIVRYIKHLVQISFRRNSFHLTLAVCRLLYHYTTEETMAIYDFLVQDPECHCEDYYCRARKRVLMRELSARFGPWLEILRGFRGEERFRSRQADDRQLELVMESLRKFIPWETACVVPERFDPLRQEIPELRSTGDDVAREHRVEMSRMHVVLHPTCLSRVTRALGLDPPEKRLIVPLFLDRGSRGDSLQRGIFGSANHPLGAAAKG